MTTKAQQKAAQDLQDKTETAVAETFAETRAELSGRLGVFMFGGLPQPKEGSVGVPTAPDPAVSPTPPAPRIPRIHRKKEPTP